MCALCVSVSARNRERHIIPSSGIGFTRTVSNSSHESAIPDSLESCGITTTIFPFSDQRATSDQRPALRALRLGLKPVEQPTKITKLSGSALRTLQQLCPAMRKITRARITRDVLFFPIIFQGFRFLLIALLAQQNDFS